MQISKKGMTLFVTLDASQLTDMTAVTVTLVTSSQADLYNTAHCGIVPCELLIKSASRREGTEPRVSHGQFSHSIFW